MQQHRIISLLSILVMLIIPVIGWFLIAQPQLAQASTADQQRSDAAAQVAATQAIVEQLQADSAKLPDLNQELNELRGSIPAEIDPDGWLDGLSAQARVSKVQITGITVQDAVSYVPATPPVDPNAPVAGDSAETPAEGEEGATPVETPAPAPVDFPGIVTNPLIDSSNFVAIPVSVEVTGTLKTIFRFVNGLQTDNRLYLVNGVGYEPIPGGSTYSSKIEGYIWAIPTGVEGKPKPVSTVVKSMDPPTPPETETETETPDPNATGGPTPNPTETPAP